MAGDGRGGGSGTGGALQGRPQVFIDDLLTALRALEIGSTDTAVAVMRMLSLDNWQDIVATDLARASGDVAQPAAPTVPLPFAAAATPVAAVPSDAPAPAAAARPDSAESPALSIRRLPTTDRPAPPLWLSQVLPLVRAVRASSPPPEPLFDPLQERALLGALSACQVNDGELHIDHLLEELSRGVMPRVLPLRASWGTRRGLQLLVDDGPGMAPFRHDVEHLWTRLGSLLPADRLSRLAFEGCPGRGCRVARRRGTRPWTAPECGGAVLVVSDLGIAAAEPAAGAAPVAEWLDFCARAESAGVQLRALVPYPAQRWPATLASRLHPVAWDRRTSAAVIRHAVAAAASHRSS